MENLFPLLNVNGRARHACTAAVPGTGPAGQVCSKCALLEPSGSKNFVCGKFRALTGRNGKPISPGIAACKYFIERAPFNSSKGVL